jgi:alkanesulfonate monooxygenase SsuD/methylene tetrahydromethanopterin reductase-like flavin-dependent oxidoreductase (luciferase family)
VRDRVGGMELRIFVEPQQGATYGDQLVSSNAHTVCVGADETEVGRRAQLIGRSFDDLRENALAGTPQQVIEIIGRYAVLGATRMYLQVLDLHDLDQIRLIADEVMPRV